MIDRRMMLTAGAITAVFLVGCGGDDEDEPAGGGSESAAPTKEEFISQGDEICRDGDQEIEAGEEEAFGGGRPSPDEVEAFLTETVIPSIQKQIDGIADLTPPEGDEQTVAGLVDMAQGALDEVEQDPAALAERGSPDPFAETQRAFGDYGFQDCAQD